MTAGGKNVAPAVARGPAPRARAGRPVHRGRRRPAVHRRPRHPRPRGAARLGGAPRQEARRRKLVDDPDLLAEIEAAVEEANKAVSKAESIRKFRVLADEWTEEGGQLTPSLKLKRNVVMREVRDDIAALYVP